MIKLFLLIISITFVISCDMSCSVDTTVKVLSAGSAYCTKCPCRAYVPTNSTVKLINIKDGAWSYDKNTGEISAWSTCNGCAFSATIAWY